MKILVGVLLVLTLPIAVSCTKTNKGSEDDEQKTETPDETQTAWYAVGMSYNMELDCVAATVWKDGSVLYADSKEETMSVALGVCVDGEDVYSCGMVENSVSLYNVLWKNGEQVLSVDMESEVLSGYIVDGFTDVAVAGEDVYVIASLYRNITGTSYQTTPVLFKNGKPSLFDTKSNDVEVNSLDGVGNDLYAAGSVDVNGMVTPAVWKNGVITHLEVPQGSVEGAAYSVSVCGKDVYVMGEVYTLTNDNALPCIWKNGEPVQLNSDPKLDTYATGVAVNADDVYVSGIASSSDEEFAVLWHNGDQSMLATGAAMGVVCCKDDVVVGGYTYEGDDYSNPVVATVWVNGVPQYLDYGVIVRMY